MAARTMEIETSGETMYERLESLVEGYGEVMIRFDSGTEAELHRHNTEFVGAPMIEVRAADAVHWFDAEKVESYWIHYEF